MHDGGHVGNNFPRKYLQEYGKSNSSSLRFHILRHSPVKFSRGFGFKGRRIFRIRRGIKRRMKKYFPCKNTPDSLKWALSNFGLVEDLDIV